MAVTFKPEVVKEFEAVAARYPVRRAALLPALWLAQREFGWISEDAMVCVAKLRRRVARAGNGSRWFLHHVPKDKAG